MTSIQISACRVLDWLIKTIPGMSKGNKNSFAITYVTDVDITCLQRKGYI